jgi:hypothetical protein
MVSMTTISSLKRFASRPNHLFWLLQFVGWTGYFALSFLSAIGYGKPFHYIWVSAGAALAGLAITCVLRLGFRAIWHWRTDRMVAAAIVLLLVATAVYARFYAEVVFRWCWDCRPSSLLGYLGYFGSTLYVMLSWSGLYFGIKFARQSQQQKEAALRAQSIAHAAQHAADGTDPPGDLNATPDYKRHLAQVLTRRALEQAAGASS